jgi:hypothetical protein
LRLIEFHILLLARARLARILQNRKIAL